MRFVQEHSISNKFSLQKKFSKNSVNTLFNKFSKNPVFDPFLVCFPNLWEKKKKKLSKSNSFMKNFIQISSTMSKLKNTTNATPRKRLDRQRNRQNDGRMDKSYFIGHLLLQPQVYLIVASKFTYPYQFVIIVFLLIKGLNILHCSTFYSFIFLVQKDFLYF